MGDSGPKAGAKSVVEDIKGKVKQATGSLTGNDDLEQEGKAQQDKADNQREVAKHEAKAEASRAKAEADDARERAAQKAR